MKRLLANYRLVFVQWLLLNLLVVVSQGCGVNAGNTTVNSDDNVNRNNAVVAGNSNGKTTFSGSLVKGPVEGADIEVYSLDAEGKPDVLLGTATTDKEGKFTLSADLSAEGILAQPILVQSYGGSYIDESTRQRIYIPYDYSMTTVLNKGDSTISLGLTPVSSIATKIALNIVANDATTDLKTAVAESKSLTGTIFGLVDIDFTHLIPHDLVNNENAAQASEATIQYSLVLSAMSQYAVENELSPDSVLALSSEIAKSNTASTSQSSQHDFITNIATYTDKFVQGKAAELDPKVLEVAKKVQLYLHGASLKKINKNK